MRTTRARSNPVTTNEKIAIGVGLALGVGGLIFLFTRPSAASGGAKQPGGMVDKNGNPISVDNQPNAPPATPPPATPPPKPPDGNVATSAHPLLDAAVAAIKAYDTLMQTSYTDEQKQTAWNAAYLAMSAALRGGELGSTGQVFTDANNALILADGIRDNWVDAQNALTTANAINDAQAIAAAEAAFTLVSAQLDNARNDAYNKMSLAVTALTLPPDIYQKAFSDLFNLGL